VLDELLNFGAGNFARVQRASFRPQYRLSNLNDLESQIDAPYKSWM
jgi:hypothetical protein